MITFKDFFWDTYKDLMKQITVLKTFFINKKIIKSKD